MIRRLTRTRLPSGVRHSAVREGVLRKHRLRYDGSWRDTVQYAMVDDDWPAARAALTARLG
jgi:hypothetical protein